jgi:ureidoacrylate peracid hydrolase
MHEFKMPDAVVASVVARRGREHPLADFDPARTALLVVDMQNGFLMDGVAHSLIPAARDIVPNINRLAGAMRASGGLVVWIKNTVSAESIRGWPSYDRLSTPARRQKRIDAMREGSIGHELWAELDPRPEDLVVKKTRFSAFIQGSSPLEEMLRERGIDTLLATGTATGVCCESTARDAMMLGFNAIMVSDANAAPTDEEHSASLIAFYMTFGDVMTTDEVIGFMMGAHASPGRAAVG